MRTEHIAGEKTPTAALPRECAPKTVDALLADIRHRAIVQPEARPIRWQRGTLKAQRNRRVLRGRRPECLCIQVRSWRCVQMNANIDRVPVMINSSLVLGDLLFATHRDRCLYIGTSIIDQPRWLQEHTGSWRRIGDVHREAAALAPPVEGETNVGAAPP